MINSPPISFMPLMKNVALRRGAIFGSILICALIAFEVFNFGTTAFALGDALGDLAFAGMRWSTILAIAFCGIDFAGIARIFTPEQGPDERAEVFYLFAAWFLAASFNAILTWWGVSVAIINHNAAGSVLIGRAMLTNTVPIFVAVMVWLTRLLLIGTFSIAGERLFSMADARPSAQNQPAYTHLARDPRPAAVSQTRPLPRPVSSNYVTAIRPEPTYHPVGISAAPKSDNNSVRR